MGLSSFSRDDPIFRDESVLRDSYKPETLRERDEELAAYQNALLPVINGAPPKNIFVYGQTGVGKTISTDLVLGQLRQDAENYDDLDVFTLKLNCKDLKSSYQVAANLVNKFREGDSTPGKIPTTGYPSGMVYEMLWDHLEELDATHALIVLDEIDSIGNDDELLYQLPRANDNEKVTSTYVGVIGICNNFTFRDDLSSRVKDTLCEEELHFPPYDATELRTILEQRTEAAFEPDALERGVVQLCAAFAAQESGSARQALALLYKSGEIARAEDCATVEESHVRQAKEQIVHGRIRDELGSLPDQSKVTLYTVTHLCRKGQTPAKRRSIYKYYERFAKQIDTRPLSIRSVHDRLSDLTLKGFLEVEEQNKGRQGGSYYIYDLAIEPSLVEETFQDDSRMSSLFEQ